MSRAACASSTTSSSSSPRASVSSTTRAFAHDIGQRTPRRSSVRRVVGASSAHPGPCAAIRVHLLSPDGEDNGRTAGPVAMVPLQARKPREPSMPTSVLLAGIVFLATACNGPAPRPPAPDLVDLAAVDPTIRLDLRYATPDNF